MWASLNGHDLGSAWFWVQRGSARVGPLVCLISGETYCNLNAGRGTVSWIKTMAVLIQSKSKLSIGSRLESGKKLH